MPQQKKWWDTAKRELKKDGHFQVPVKKTDPIIYQVQEVSLQDRLLAEFRAAKGLKAKLAAAFTGTADPEERTKVWAELQALIYEQVPAIKVGNAYSYDIASKKLKGMGESSLLWPHFWNVSY